LYYQIQYIDPDSTNSFFRIISCLERHVHKLEAEVNNERIQRRWCMWIKNFWILCYCSIYKWIFLIIRWTFKIIKLKSNLHFRWLDKSSSGTFDIKITKVVRFMKLFFRVLKLKQNIVNPKRLWFETSMNRKIIYFIWTKNQMQMMCLFSFNNLLMIGIILIGLNFSFDL